MEFVNSTSTGGAIEVKYQKNALHQDVVITPKLSISLSGIVGVYYGYNISTKGDPFFNMGHHQFSLVCNLMRKPFR